MRSQTSRNARYVFIAKGKTLVSDAQCRLIVRDVARSARDVCKLARNGPRTSVVVTEEERPRRFDHVKAHG